MLITECKKPYAIKKHIKGTFYKDDCYVLDNDYKIMIFAYRNIAEHKCEELNSIGDACTYRVVMVD